MAASVLCAGASQWFTNSGAGKAWEYLGMCESDTMLDLSPQWQGISIDGSAGGDFDRQLMGVSAGVSGNLARWDENVLDNLKSFLNDSANLTAGQWPTGSFGTLVRTEEKAFSLCIVSLFATKDAYSNVGMHPCWVFPFVMPQPMQRNLSTRATRERISFEAIVVSNGQGGGTLYTNALPSGLPTPT